MPTRGGGRAALEAALDAVAPELASCAEQARSTIELWVRVDRAGPRVRARSRSFIGHQRSVDAELCAELAALRAVSQLPPSARRLVARRSASGSRVARPPAQVLTRPPTPEQQASATLWGELASNALPALRACTRDGSPGATSTATVVFAARAGAVHVEDAGDLDAAVRACFERAVAAIPAAVEARALLTLPVGG